MKTIAELYGDWWEGVKPVDCGSEQTIEMKRAFYSGVMQAFMMVQDAAAECPEEEAVAQLQSWLGEGREYLLMDVHAERGPVGHG